MNPLETYFQNVVARLNRDGWVEIIIPLIAPTITQLIARCFDSGEEMAESASRLTFRQKLGLMAAARQIAVDAGIPSYRRRAAINAITAAIENEYRAQVELDRGMDVWRQAYMDACAHVSV